MNRIARIAMSIAVVAAVAVLASVVTAAVNRPGRNGDDAATVRLSGQITAASAPASIPPDQARTPDFSISGSNTSDLLVPGGTVSLPLQLSNPYGFALQVQSLGVTVSAVSAAGCPTKIGANSIVTADALSAAVTVPSRGTAQATLTLHLDSTAPYQCADATFTLRYTGNAVRA